MCQWAWITLFSAVKYCRGYNECTIDGGETGLVLARASKISIILTPGIKYTVFTDGRDASLPNLTSLVAHTSHADRILSGGNGDIYVDPWTITAFRKETTVHSDHASWLVVDSPRSAAGPPLSIGVCPEGLAPWNLIGYLLLPLSRLRAQIWRKAAISLSWPLLVYPLVASWRRRSSGFVVVLETLVVADTFYWAGFGFATLELVDSVGMDVFGVVLAGLITTSAISASIKTWYGHRLATALIMLTSPLWSAFYWTPLALLYAVLHDYAEDAEALAK